MKKRILSLALALSLVLALVPAGMAASGYTEVVTFMYDDVRPFSGGFAAVAVGEWVDVEYDWYTYKSLDAKWGFIDKSGKEIAPCKYDGVTAFSDGLARVRLNGSFGYIDETGAEVLPLIYDYASEFSMGSAWVELNDEGFYIDKTGSRTEPSDDDDDEPVPPYISYIWDAETESSAYILTDKDGIKIRLEYDSVYGFSDGMARVSLREEYGYKYGYIDEAGNEVIPAEYDNAGDISEGMAAVGKGEWVSSPISDQMIFYGKWGFIAVGGANTSTLSNFTKAKTYTAGTFTDIDNQWYTDWVTRAYEYGIISGIGNNKFNPTGNLSGAEALTIGARIHAVYKYGAADSDANIQAYKADGDQWYDMYVKYCKVEGLIGNELDSKLTAYITRAEMVFAWSKLLQESDMTKQNTVNSLPDVASDNPYFSHIKAFYEAGIIAGTDSNGTFKPDNNISRTEAATIFMKLIDASARGSGKTFG